MADTKAMERLEKLLDEGSFVELGAYVTARSTDFSLKHQSEPSDGVITGYGQIEGIPVFVYSQNRAVLNGTMGEMHAKKISDLYDKAMRSGAPVIGLLDCGGFRLEESVDALDGFGGVLAKQMECQGKLLMISGVFGVCAGGMTLIPALSDFTYMAASADMFVNAPRTITDNAAMAREFSSAAYQNTASGQAEVLETEDDVIGRIRSLVSLFEDAEYGCCDLAELNRHIASGTIAETVNTRALLRECGDFGEFFEIRPDYCPEMVTGFLKLNGILTGVVGNAPALFDEQGGTLRRFPKRLTARGCGKAAEFLTFCSEKSLPVLTVSAADGFAATEETERNLPQSLAGMMRALAALSGARVNLIIGDTYGSAYVAMHTKPLQDGSFMTLAWDSARVGMMEAEKAANILFSGDPARDKQAAAYESGQNSVRSAAAHGLIDSVIEPKDTRKHLIMAFSML
ncbi:MAG: carboxyl transferase [Lachnospiraceae bacterium]|nr:carboxyl transferase [Lachnospiraceae bacterium]